MTVEQLAVKLGVKKSTIKSMAAYYGIEVTTSGKTARSKFFNVHEMEDKTWLI